MICCLFFFFFFTVYLFLLRWVFITALGEQGYSLGVGAWPSRCGGFSCCGARVQ